jgi:hypothetical protein
MPFTADLAGGVTVGVPLLDVTQGARRVLL